MATLIVDIDTKAEKWGDLPGITRSSLTQWIDKADFSEQEKHKKTEYIKSNLAFSPFTASIISLAVYDVERRAGSVYFVSDTPDDSFSVDDYTFKQRNEAQILEDFWEGAKSYDTFVSFNGRSFLMPFLHHRSVMNKVKPTVEIARQRFLTRQAMPYHVDLMDELSLYGGMKHRPSLHLMCGAYNIDNTSLLGGEEIAEAFADKRFRYIAEKNMGDVQAITELYKKWKEYLAPASFINTVDI